MPVKRPSSRFIPTNTRKTLTEPTIIPPVIKHCTFPAVPKLSSLSFLSLSLIICLTSTLTQYINLYKTVWWLPNSSIQYAIEFDLIDYYVIAHILFMLCTPYLYLIFIKIIPSFILNSFIIRSILGLVIFTFWSYIMLWIVSSIEYSGVMILYNISGIILLTYFPVITFIIYHFRYLEKMIYPSNRYRHPQQQQQHQHYHHHQHHHHHHHQQQQQQQHYNTTTGGGGGAGNNSNYQKTSSHSTFARLIHFLK
ncbi:unnamed protein product, partial [Trichobilharzia szidati]